MLSEPSITEYIKNLNLQSEEMARYWYEDTLIPFKFWVHNFTSAYDPGSKCQFYEYLSLKWEIAQLIDFDIDLTPCISVCLIHSWPKCLCGVHKGMLLNFCFHIM